ncbi:MerR family transcriptional regulator [Amycolatopsis rhabdoformis]|uniref:MerR family transcriptional regulator n=1 Tax=Amycolatopsis rhabdoformis TaxID=1448059 RepID=A0ABZ1ILR1_9PSEU|nr:MerR family transcriptional regulator [Amycolatopsis rhabdoformis]WSE34701.1 MerR family transcriptional regulator [Amycolatopsis rhabdoformis]
MKMRIGELSQQTGASQRALRYYEEKGLLTSVRTSSGQRHYTDDHVARVKLIQDFLAAGMSSRVIAEFAPCMSRRDAQWVQRASEAMSRERDRLSGAIAELVKTRAALEDLMAAHHRDLT